MLGFHVGHISCPKKEIVHDTEYWLQQVNRASVVANLGMGLLDRETAIMIREALNEIRRESDSGEVRRSDLYIEFEPKLLKLCGNHASVLHAGRSSQDILATCNAALNRERLLMVAYSVIGLCHDLIETARRESDAVVPAYTNGVQAQPTLYSHYLLAHVEVFSRDIERLIECWQRHDVCPMGSCVCTGTGWPLDTARMAKLLGFKKTADNAFDAGQCRGNDFPLEMSQIIASIMLHVNAFLADFMQQYAQTKPWIQSLDKNGVYHSSSMPQKRNPGLINDCRRDAGLVISSAQSVMVRMQNLPLGMADVRDAWMMQALTEDSAIVIETFAGIIRSLQVDRERARDELMSEWTCSQEIADTLMRQAGIDFRTGHGFASEFVTQARSKGWTPKNVEYEDFCRVWASYSLKHNLDPTFPLDEETIRSATIPELILSNRRTFGSASPLMIDEQIENCAKTIAQFSDWISKTIEEQEDTATQLEAELASI